MDLTWICDVAGGESAGGPCGEEGGGSASAEASSIGHGEDELLGRSDGEGEGKGTLSADICVWGDGDVAGDAK